MLNKLKRKNRRIEVACHFWLGLQQLASHLYYNIVTLGLLAFFMLVWKKKDGLFAGLPEFLLPLVQPLASILLVIAAMLLLLVWIEEVGRRTAERNEGHLIAAFTATDLRNGYHPVLVSKRRDKKTGATIREFYSQIPLSRWQERCEAIADFMDVTLVEPYITYGGKNQDKGYRIIMHSLPGRKLKDRGDLYDQL